MAEGEARGGERMSGVGWCVMRVPPGRTTLRFDPWRLSEAEALGRLGAGLGGAWETRVHEALPNVLVVEGGESQPALEPRDDGWRLELYVDASAGAAILRGAQLFACGIVASSGDFAPGDACSVWMILGGKCLRGSRLTLPSERKAFLGLGRLHVDRASVFTKDFRQLDGLGVELRERVWPRPSLGDRLGSWATAQNVPSVVATALLGPREGQRLLDLCSAPGGKTTALAEAVGPSGVVVAVEVREARMKDVRSAVHKLRLTNVRCVVADGREICSEGGSEPDGEPPFAPGSFDGVLVDAPCSSLGQRPARKSFHPSQAASTFPPLQSSLLEAGLKLLRHGGRLVYSTCTLDEGENEAVVAAALRRHADLRLCPVPEELRALGGPSASALLSPDQRDAVLLFDPRPLCPAHPDADCLRHPHAPAHFRPSQPPLDIPPHRDTIGFFAALLEKQPA